MLEHTSCVGIGGQDMMKTMAIINKINGLGPELFFLNFSKGVYHDFWVSQIPMILFFRHGSCQVLSKKQIKAAGEVALGWVPLDFIFALCLLFFFFFHISWGWVCLDSIFDRFWGK